MTATRPLYSVDGEKALYNVTEDPSVQTGTMSDVLQNAPGVEVDAEGNITLRGSSNVEIWINDRPAHMNEEALKQYVKQLPANSVERVEVISNPSARYNSKGAVINIVTTKKVKKNELLCVGLNARTSPNISPWLSYVHANEKFDINVYLNADVSHHKMESDIEDELRDSDSSLSRSLHSVSKSRLNSVGGYAGLNMNWHIDSLTELSVWAGAYPYWFSGTATTSHTYLEYKTNPGDYSYDEHAHEGNRHAGGYAGGWFERAMRGDKKLRLSFNGSYWGQNDSSHTDELYRVVTSLNNVNHSESTHKYLNGEVQLSYIWPMKHNFEFEIGTGMAASMENADEKYDTLDMSTHNYFAEYERTYSIVNKSDELAAYATLQKRWNRFVAKLGIRAVETWISTECDHVGFDDSYDFFGIVPSLHLSYSTENFHSFNLSYTLRNSVPDGGQLSRFIIYDDRHFSTGNPALRMSYTHNFEAGWNKYLPGVGMVGLNGYVRANIDEVSTLTDVATMPYYGGALVGFIQPVNVGNSHTEGLEANMTFRPTAMLNVRLNASLFNYGYSTTFRGQELNENKLSWSMRLNLWTKLWNKVEVFVNARYSSPKLALYSLTNSSKGVDFGFSSDFFERKLTVFLNVNDIFGLTEWGSSNTNPYNVSSNTQRYDSKSISLGVTFRVGKMELESKARQGSTEVPAAM